MMLLPNNKAAFENAGRVKDPVTPADLQAALVQVALRLGVEHVTIEALGTYLAEKRAMASGNSIAVEPGKKAEYLKKNKALAQHYLSTRFPGCGFNECFVAALERHGQFAFAAIAKAKKVGSLGSKANSRAKEVEETRKLLLDPSRRQVDDFLTARLAKDAGVSIREISQRLCVLRKRLKLPASALGTAPILLALCQESGRVAPVALICQLYYAKVGVRIGRTSEPTAELSALLGSRSVEKMPLTVNPPANIDPAILSAAQAPQFPQAPSASM